MGASTSGVWAERAHAVVVRGPEVEAATRLASRVVLAFHEVDGAAAVGAGHRLFIGWPVRAVRGFGRTRHYIDVESRATTFQSEVAAIQASARVCVTDAVCRIPRLRRAFAAEIEPLRQRLLVLEDADELAGRRVTRRMIGWFWRGLALVLAAAFAAGYLVSLRR